MAAPTPDVILNTRTQCSKPSNLRPVVDGGGALARGGRGEGGLGLTCHHRRNWLSDTETAVKRRFFSPHAYTLSRAAIIFSCDCLKTDVLFQFCVQILSLIAALSIDYGLTVASYDQGGYMRVQPVAVLFAF